MANYECFGWLEEMCRADTAGDATEEESLEDIFSVFFNAFRLYSSFCYSVSSKVPKNETRIPKSKSITNIVIASPTHLRQRRLSDDLQ